MTSRNVLRIATVVAVGATTTILAAGCSSSGSTDPSQSPSPTGTLPAAPLTLTGGTISPVGAKGSNVQLSGTFTNTSGTEVKIVGGASGVATQITVVESTSANKTPTPANGGIAVPPNGKVTLSSPGRQLQFNKLTAPLKAGQVVKFAVIQSNGSAVSVSAVVKAS